MKKFLAFISVLAMLFGIFYVASAATQPALSVTVKGDSMAFASADKPFIKANKVFLSANAVSTKLGLTTTKSNKTYTIVNGTTNVKFTVGKRVFYVNNKAYALPKVVRLKGGTPFITEEFYRKALGLKVSYTAKTNALTIGEKEVAVAPTPAPAPTPEPTKLILATTTSTKDSGFLDVFIPKFEAKYNVKVVINSVGTGAALAFADRGDADVILTHAPSSEAPYVSSGKVIDYKKVMYNDFKIVGPKDNPAGLDKYESVASAMQKIYDGKFPFVSRNDGSGTQTKEFELWKLVTNTDSTADPKPKLSPVKDVKLYNEQILASAGMATTLSLANQRGAYSLTDRGTWLNLKDDGATSNLMIVNEGSTNLTNYYHVSRVNPDKWPAGQVNVTQAIQFIQFLLSPEGEQIVRNYKIKGENAFDWWGEAY